MKPNYKNWVPKGMVVGVLIGAQVVGGALFAVVSTTLLTGSVKLFAEIILGIVFVGLLIFSVVCINWYTTFSYNGKKQFARRIIEKVSGYIILPENGKGLDIGCGSGALTIACAKKNSNAFMIGLDRWGKEYACKLTFEDDTFDAVTSNYCYHNIPSKDRQAIILETLRVLKKGGTFAIHDLFSKEKYGDMNKLLGQLHDMGYEKVELLDTTDGLFMIKKEARVLCMNGSALLVGKKQSLVIPQNLWNERNIVQFNP